jgi:hypothetical protein
MQIYAKKSAPCMYYFYPSCCYLPEQWAGLWPAAGRVIGWTGDILPVTFSLHVVSFKYIWHVASGLVNF